QLATHPTSQNATIRRAKQRDSTSTCNTTDDLGAGAGAAPPPAKLVAVNRMDRLYALVEELRASAPRARTARHLADRFEVSVRTIERDLSALQQSGVPVWATPGPGGGYTLDPSMTLPPLNFTADEAAAVAVALAVSGPIPYADAARAALRKLVAAMSATGREGARDLAGRIRLLQQTGELARTPVVRAVESAVLHRQVLELDYVDKDGNRTD